MSEVTMTDIETIRKWIGVEYEDGRGDEAYEALSRIERVVEAAREYLDAPSSTRMGELVEALGALDG